MKSRDISYVVHAIMRPILATPASHSDYDIQYMQRQGAAPAPPAVVRVAPLRADKKKKNDKNNDKNDDEDMDATSAEIASRSKKAKEWSSEHAVLGYVAKTNVARPRALLADTMAMATTEDSEVVQNKQRASLWKARIYCDQAYQAYAAVVESWRSAQPGTVPSAAVQPHLIKLLKCLGLTRDAETEEYRADSAALELLLKLHKGKVLVSRVLEQALLPPNAVQALLPTILQVLYTTTSNKESSSTDSAVDDRLFSANARIVQTLPNLSGPTILKSIQIVQANTGTALQSTARMHTVHALLQRGSVVAGNSDDAAFQSEWKETETEFMKVLTGM